MRPLAPNITLALGTLGLSFGNPIFLAERQQHAMTATVDPNGWHPGELAAHTLLGVTTSARRNPTSAGLPGPYAYRIAASPFLAVGALDPAGRPWTSLWGGERGCARAVAPGVVAVQSLVSAAHDPVLDALVRTTSSSGPALVRPGPDARPPISALAIDLDTRDRVKLAGRLLVAALADGDAPVRDLQMAFAVEESLGNCPKYLNRKTVRAHLPSLGLGLGLVSGGSGKATGWGPEARRVVEQADMFFLSTTDGGRTMDTNHRGGAPGFVRVLRDDDDSDKVELVYPEFSGNQLYQTLGNLQVDGRVGLAVPDFVRGDVLFVTGTAEVLVGSAAAEVMPRARVAVRIAVDEARFVPDALPFRGDPGEPSPYNPPVRRLAAEMMAAAPLHPGRRGGGGNAPPAVATLVRREVLTPTVARFTFSLQVDDGETRPRGWRAGDHVTLDFSDELDAGYSHMRDSDPQSLNDDFVRTFTISSPPPPGVVPGEPLANGTEVEITARRHGPATALLWRHQHPDKVPLAVPVLGFGSGSGGGESFRIAAAPDGTKAVFVAGGVGITPLLAQAPAVLALGKPPLAVLWSLRADDLGLALDAFARIPGLAGATQLFVTRPEKASPEDTAKVEAAGSTVVSGRMAREHLLAAKATAEQEGTTAKFYVCTSPEMQALVLAWLDGELVATESFAY